MLHPVQLSYPLFTHSPCLSLVYSLTDVVKRYSLHRSLSHAILCCDSLTSQHYSFTHPFTLSLTSSLFHLSTQKNRTCAIVLWLTYSLIPQKSLSLALARPVTFVDEKSSVKSKILNDWNLGAYFTVSDHTGVFSVLRAI